VNYRNRVAFDNSSFPPYWLRTISTNAKYPNCDDNKVAAKSQTKPFSLPRIW
jgi:hypothetical protein